MANLLLKINLILLPPFYFGSYATILITNSSGT